MRNVPDAEMPDVRVISEEQDDEEWLEAQQPDEELTPEESERVETLLRAYEQSPGIFRRTPVNSCQMPRPITSTNPA